MTKLIAGSCCALLLWTTPTPAASVYRCSDADGNLTFTQQGCPAAHTTQIQRAVNPTPGSGKAVPLATPNTRSKAHQVKSGSVTVVGKQDDGCGNLITDSERRNAVIRQQILSGMTRADVESAFGTPDAVTSRNGKTQYRYSHGKGGTRTVSFDEHGCVGGKR